MYISWLGHSAFKIQAKVGGEDIVLITDPYDKKVGFKMPRKEADVVTISHDHFDHNNVAGVSGEPFVVNEPGEYEYKKIFIYGIPSFHDMSEGKERGNNIIFRIEIEDVSIVHLGDLGQESLTSEQLEKLEKVDVLMIPVGGKYTIDSKSAVNLINQIEPRIVIPMHYKIKGLKIDGIDTVDEFCKEMGVCQTEAVRKLKVTKKDLPQDEMQVIIMER